MLLSLIGLLCAAAVAAAAACLELSYFGKQKHQLLVKWYLTAGEYVLT